MMAPEFPANTAHPSEQRILGFQHPLLKLAASLHRSKARREEQRFLIEGKHPLEEALKTKLRFEAVFLQEQAPCLEAFAKLPIPHYRLSVEQMRKISDTDSPPPVLGMAHLPKAPSLETLSPERPLLVFDGLQDPGNVGTLLRSAWAFGIRQLLLLPPAVDLYSPKVIRASAGGVFHLTSCSLDASLEETLEYLQEQGFLPVLTTGNSASAQPIASLSPTALQSVALVLGQEGSGIRLRPEAWARYPQWTVPMMPDVDSLNVAVSGSILMASWLNQRQCESSSSRNTPNGTHA